MGGSWRPRCSGWTQSLVCGSGTTLIAAEQNNRICYAIEISPAYCAVILQRFQDATGVTPTLVTDV
jgi:DNA modification methylase